jgi:hypothetical protein
MSSDPVQMLIEAGAFPDTTFAPNSRYHGVAIGRLKRDADDPGTPYVLRRFIPQARDIGVAGEHIVNAGERPDLLAAQQLSDSELQWRIADANVVADPFELTDTPGGRVVIPRPPGL